jgi:tRNA threonylcarbamoyladenosine biosynthesis protein TsaB
MKLLAIETSTESLSIALGQQEPGGTLSLVAQHEGAGGAQSSATLLPALRQLLAQAGWSLRELTAIVFGEGPGSFTGLRTACSVAQGLALGADLPVLPIDTLMAVAEQARSSLPAAQNSDGPHILAAMDARMNEVYFGLYHWMPSPAGAPAWQHAAVQVAAPEALPALAATLLAGNARAVYGARLPAALQALPALHCLPSASALLRLAPALLASGQARDPALALPRYVRDKVAQTSAERLAERQAATAASARNSG